MSTKTITLGRKLFEFSNKGHWILEGQRIWKLHEARADNSICVDQLGRIWRCEGPGVQQLTDAGTYTLTGVADFAAAWLRKIEPEGDRHTTTEQRELTA